MAAAGNGGNRRYDELREARRRRDGTATVLVIDDEYGARLQVELALVDDEHLAIVGTATNGSRGAELAEELQPDVVVLDLSMPVMDGFEALPLIRRVAPGARVLVRTSHDEEEMLDRAMQLGATACIPKFLSFDDLRALIERAARGHASPVLVEAVARCRARKQARPAGSR